MNAVLLALSQKFELYCSCLNASAIFRTSPADHGAAHVEYIGAAYHYVSTERGRENERRIATDEDEILYWLLSDIVFDLSCSFEVKHRVKGQSFRRLLFAKELELMRSLNPGWETRKRSEINAILAEAPYDDIAEG
jgi:hypothetical protein